jgi:DNA-binding NarL/FixJ family response regulator
VSDGGPDISVVLVDDHRLFREGVREMLGSDPAFTVVGEGSCGEDAVRLVEEHGPDVLLVDVEMPGLDVREVIARCLRSRPGTRSVVLTMHDEPVLVKDLLDRGASAYLVKTITRHELVAALRSVTTAPGNVLVSVPRDALTGLDRTADRSPLSERETEVLRLVAQAMSNAQIARVLFISVGTVKRHLTNIYHKLGASSRMDAVRKAVNARLIDG